MAIAGPALLGAGSLALPFAANALLQRLRLRRVLPVVRRAFLVLDPLFNEHLASYRGSDAQFAAELVTAALADGQLSREETAFAVAEILRRWSPVVAAGKTVQSLPEQSPERRLYGAVADMVSHGGFSANGLSQALQAAKQVLR
jgi:hypothetical protein